MSTNYSVVVWTIKMNTLNQCSLHYRSVLYVVNYCTHSELVTSKLCLLHSQPALYVCQISVVHRVSQQCKYSEPVLYIQWTSVAYSEPVQFIMNHCNYSDPVLCIVNQSSSYSEPMLYTDPLYIQWTSAVHPLNQCCTYSELLAYTQRTSGTQKISPQCTPAGHLGVFSLPYWKLANNIQREIIGSSLLKT